ncbi:MAG TPA: hypothetical protein VFV67_32445 [Actinophytocola sp.]|uniref:hypothetical protein n=1 Tax=Actinophytocola sp. TaxID=1872138 RepID=UPI002DBA1D98|nr:hypothetical protein [Actinophytocola sp.]HEU5475378.1 hypothetical protein [Actinophytocola sp.]
MIRAGVRAGLVAGVLSGAPSTVYALLAGRDVLEATVAAGSILLPNETRRGRLLAAALPVHCGLSVGWGVVLAAVLPRRRTVPFGVAAGAAIAALDLGLVGRRLPRIRALPVLPQVLDHLLFGAVAGAVLARQVHRSGPLPVRR